MLYLSQEKSDLVLKNLISLIKVSFVIFLGSECVNYFIQHILIVESTEGACPCRGEDEQNEFPSRLVSNKLIVSRNIHWYFLYSFKRKNIIHVKSENLKRGRSPSLTVEKEGDCARTIFFAAFSVNCDILILTEI